GPGSLGFGRRLTGRKGMVVETSVVLLWSTSATLSGVGAAASSCQSMMRRSGQWPASRMLRRRVSGMIGLNSISDPFAVPPDVRDTNAGESTREAIDMGRAIAISHERVSAARAQFRWRANY